MNKTELEKNLFEINNARNISRKDLVKTFVPTDTFWELLTPKHHIVLGARGSGKTALAKMLSHDHLAHFDHKKTKKIIESKSLIGIYFPTSIEWTSILQNSPYQTEVEAEEVFRWHFNLSVCLAFLVTLRSCLETYIKDRGKRVRTEELIVQYLNNHWFEGKEECKSIEDLHNSLDNLADKKRRHIQRIAITGERDQKEGIIGIPFGLELFVPLRQAIVTASKQLGLPEDCNWILCIDEAELLTEMQQKIIFSHMRAHTKNLFFKITTMPYRPETIGTNTPVPLDAGHDYNYIYIDRLNSFETDIDDTDSNFATNLFTKIASASGRKYADITLNDLLGTSVLLDRKDSEWSYDSENMKLLKMYANRKTIERAESLADYPKEFSDQITRKIHGALLLRHAVKSQKGRAEIDVYSGVSLVIRCSDGNPRRLIDIYNCLLQEYNKNPSRKQKPLLSRKSQTRVLILFARSTLSRIQSEPECGQRLFELLEKVGNYMHSNLHDYPLSTDQISSITINKDLPKDIRKLIQRGVGLALLFPNMNTNHPDQLPYEGSFHVAYVLSPLFRTLPRRGKSQKLLTILKGEELIVPSQNLEQLSLFSNVDGDSSK